jgi:hypothetical protein
MCDYSIIFALCSVNSVCWAPHDFGLILACGSSDGSISVITYSGSVLCLYSAVKRLIF